MSLVRTYDPKNVIVTFGATVITGFGEGTFIGITASGASFEKKKGADGVVERVNKNADDYEVTINLTQTNPTNAVLSALHVADKLSNVGIMPLTIKDLNGTSLFFAPQAWIAKAPDPTYADSTEDREWTFETGAAGNLIGGNN